MKKYIKQKRWKLSTEVTVLTMLTSVCTLLLLGTAMLLFFLFFFFNNTQEDMEYILKNTTQQIQDKMQFIEDGAKTIRHNAMMNSFFEQKPYDAEKIEAQLSYSMDLFSERNMVQQNPFVGSVYLFNENDEYVCEQYYPLTMAALEIKQLRYQELQQKLKNDEEQFHIADNGESLDLCFPIYDEYMIKTGICIVEIRKEAVGSILADIESYHNGSWSLMAEGHEALLFYGDEGAIEELSGAKKEYLGTVSIQNKKMLLSTASCSFGIWVAAAVGRNNIYTILKPTIFIFFAVLLLGMALAAALTFGISYRFTKPLKKVTESIRAFGQEDFDVRIENFQIQEFHDIAVVFNEMAEKMEYLITQVYEKQILATQSQVKFLQAQINPHFQFNILAMLSIKAKMAGNEELYQNLQAFSKLVQGKIFREKEIKIPIAEEMELVNFYLFLQNSRYQDKITYEIKYGNEDVKQNLIPRLLIEPLVENAVSHGLEPKGGNGWVHVDVYEKDGRLHMMVEDNGVGFDADDVTEPKSGTNEKSEGIGHTHTGMENTKRLLHILYGEDYEIAVTGEKGEGTKVVIVLPIERGIYHVESDGGR